MANAIDERIKMAVVDLETTGLDARNQVPLEIGIKLIEAEGFVFHEEKWLLFEDTDFFKKCIHAAKSDQFVGPMHKKSGLWDDLTVVSDCADRGESIKEYSREVVDNDIVSWLTDCGVPFGKIPMMGSSIGSLDRPFCLQHFPNFNAFLSYRNIDVSTLKELCKMHNPLLYQNLLPIIGTKEQAKHRVLDDCDASIVEYRAYVENFLFIDGDI